MKKISGTIFLFFLCSSLRAEAGGSYGGISSQHPTGSTEIAEEALVVAYNFESYTAAGLLKDFGPHDHHGKVQRTLESEGIYGGARVFETLNDVVDVPESEYFDSPGPLTIAAWIKLNTPNLHQHIFSCDDIYVLWTTETNQYRLADTQANGITTDRNTTPVGRWHSVVAVLTATKGDVLDRDNIRIYIDGKSTVGKIQSMWAPAALRILDGCLIGAAVSGNQIHQDLHFEGVLDELLVFSRALTEQEIQIFSTKK